MFLLWVIVIFLAVSAWRLRRQAKTSDRRWSDLVGRVHALEQQVLKQTKLVARLEPLVEGLSKSKELPREAAADSAAGAAKAPAFPGEPQPELPIPPRAPEPAHGAISPRPPVLSTPQAVSSHIPPPAFGVRPPASASAGSRLKSILNIEEALGTNWLNKLGVIIFVIGLAFFLAYQLRTLGPAGKVLVGYVVSATLLGAGLLLERREKYRILARAGIGGGWALLFFVTYAMRHVAAARLLSSDALDLVLLLVVGAAMVGHTLRYRSQTVTGLAFLIAFSTLNISSVNDVYSLFAGAILALALVVIVTRMRWFKLEVLGILAAYLNHYLWLRPIIQPMGGHRHHFPEFAASAGLLIFYWAVFRASYLLRRNPEKREERVSSVAGLLNTSLLLAVMKYQSVHPEWAFWCLLVVGAVELGLGQLPRIRQRRAAFVILSTIGATLLIAAIPFRYSGSTLPILWLAESEAFLLAGVLTGEIVFRRLGMLAGSLVAGQMLSVDAAQVFGRRMDGAAVMQEPRRAVVFAVAAAIFYANAHWVSRHWLGLMQTDFEALCFRRLSYVAGLTALVGAWIAWPEAWTAVAWSVLALGLAFVGNRLTVGELSVQAHGLASAAILRALWVNLDETASYHHLTLRLITVSIVAALLYLGARWSGVAQFARTRHDRAAYTWAASALVALLVWYELRPVSVALGWTLFGLFLFEIGLERKSTPLRLQAYVAFVASFLRLFIVNLNAGGYPAQLSPRVYTTVPLALAFFYIYSNLEGRRDNFLERDRRLRASSCFSFLGTVTVAALMRFEFDPDLVVTAWAALILVLIALAWRTQRRIFLHQGLFLSFAVLFRTVLHNFYERSYFPAPPWSWHSRVFCVGAAIAAISLTLPFAFQLRLNRERAEASALNRLARLLEGLDRHPEQVFFFVPFFLMTVLLALEMPSGLVTAAWGVEAVCVFLLALSLAERSYRLAGLGLLLVCVGKIVFRDVWGLNPRDRYITFIILGAALLGVSFLYTRYRETIRQYL